MKASPLCSRIISFRPISLAHDPPGDHLGGAARSAQVGRIQVFWQRQFRAPGVLEEIGQAFHVIPALQKTMHPDVDALLDHHRRAQVALGDPDGDEIGRILSIG